MAAAYWSAARLPTTTYSGPMIELRRSSDNALADISADVDGYIDEAAMLAHCGVSDGFIRTYYDLSGNGRHLVQATAGQQQQVVASSAVMKKGTQVAGTYVLARFTEYTRADACGFSGNTQDVTCYALGQLSILRGSNQSALQIGASVDSQRFIFSSFATTNLPAFLRSGAAGRTFTGSALGTLATALWSKAASANVHASTCEQNGAATVPANQGAGAVPSITATLTSLAADSGGINRWEGQLVDVGVWEDDMIGDAGAVLTAMRAAIAARKVEAT